MEDIPTVQIEVTNAKNEGKMQPWRIKIANIDMSKIFKNISKNKRILNDFLIRRRSEVGTIGNFQKKIL